MSGNFEKLLLCTNGAGAGLPALEYGVWLAGRLNLEVTLLGIIERPGMRADVRALSGRIAGMLESAGREYRVKERTGSSRQIIPQEAASDAYLTVVGPLGRQLWHRWIRGRSFRRIQAKVSSPLIYTRTASLQLARILVCMGGLGYAQGVLDLGVLLARRLGAAVTLLHVVEPVTYEYPTAQELGAHWETVLKTDTPQGRNLREARDKAELAGVEVAIKIRNGNPVHEILAEIRTNAYDLVGMGSSYSARSLRRLYSPNVTAEVADSVECPILTVQ